jgi:hypothetical protein
MEFSTEKFYTVQKVLRVSKPKKGKEKRQNKLNGLEKSLNNICK